MQIATGTYTGDGTDGRRITTGMSGLIRGVMLQRMNNDAGFWKFDAMSPGPGINVRVGDGVINPNQLTFSGPDFIVDVTGSIPTGYNALGVDYAWMAWSK